ncbi:chaperone protein HtpG [Lachnospiraceae bacterium]|nr:chaperone protein HtpG [Lachnospiraceae bacterium]
MINLPSRLKIKLEKADIWYSNINIVIKNVEDLYITTPYFFEEYTNHGIKHINTILDILDKLISDSSLENIAEKELGICIISLILHDIGMFVSYNGFKQLLEDEHSYADLEKKKNFKESWQEYLFDLKYYSEKQLISKFGTTDIYFTELKDEVELENKERMVIGEFLRKNHHHIAHYIIVNGIENIDFLSGAMIDNETRDLIGLITRSHGMNIRDTEMYLKSKYNDISKPKNISVFYIMALLRIADYLDVGEERASHIICAFFVKKSENSKQEFSWNQCVKYEDFVWNYDRECLSVDASPKNARQFIDTKKWIKGVQYELDVCWAIIGEHYDVNKYKMTIRRLESNILKKEVVSEYEKNFYTQEAYLDANADILKLLIAPLYGNEPSYGVREILQNSVDACREREKIEKDREGNYKGEVVVSLDTEQKMMVFTDNGIGMNIDIIKRYYLIAGASYRRSEAWSKEFVGLDGNAKVLRNGKFGIGVLATFLLGEKAEVITRSYKEKKGWKFSIQLDQDNIDIERIDTEIGTKISIRVTDKTINKLERDHSWDCCNWNEWYEGNNPSVIYKVDGKIRNSHSSNFSTTYYELIQSEYSQYLWSYHNFYNQKEVCCNDIVIPRGHGFSSDTRHRFRIAVPSLKIEDLKGCLPVNLARSELLSVPCEEALYTECCKYVLAKFLTLRVKDHGDRSKFTWDSGWGGDGEYIIFSKSGYTLLDPAFIEMAGIHFVNFMAIGNEVKNDRVTIIDTDSPIIFHNLNRRGVTKALFESIISEYVLGSNMVLRLCFLHLNKKAYMYIRDELQKDKWEYLMVEEREDKFTISPENLNHLETIKFNIEEFPLVAEFDIKAKDVPKDDIMFNLLQKYLKPNCFIPYDLNERKKMFPVAFKELEKYM